jgi:hypothetical protein
MAKFKSKRYDEGGVTEGQNTGIDDDTRARAMKYVQEQSEKGSEDEGSGEKTVSRTTASKVSTKPAAAKMESKSERSTASVDDEAGRSRGRPAEGAPKGTMGANPPRNRTRAESLAAIPTGGKAGAGPTAGNGNSVEGTELSRNVKNTLSALAPLGGGVGKIGAELAMGNKAAQAAPKVAEAAEKTEKVAKAVKTAAKSTRAAREAKTLNPNAWLAGPKGMKDNFKSGGGVKGWGIARGSRAAKTY